MNTSSSLVAAAVLSAVIACTDAASLGAQSLASQVARAPDGVVRMQIDSRPGVCGDGRDLVGYRNILFARNFQSFGRWQSDDCVPGPLRVSLTVAGGEVTQLRTQVGGTWSAARSRVTDLGVVSAVDASAYLFSLVPRLEDASGKDRLLVPAVLANDAPVIQPLLALARDPRRTDGTRRQAVHWLGLFGDASVIPDLVRLARGDVDEDGDDKPGGMAGSAMAALGMLDDGIGVPALIELARDGSEGGRRNAVFWLGQNADPRARRTLHSVIEDASETSRVRKHAIFSLTHGPDVPGSEFAYLRALYPRVDPELKDAIIQGMQEDEADGGRWLIERALDAGEPLKLRKSALFWAGQRKATPTAELLRVYREAGDAAVREHALFVLAQRNDSPATDALLRIARADGDMRMREKALFWLGQKNDPRVRQLIAELVLNR